MTREIITTVERLIELVPYWYDKTFSFDTETSGTSYLRDRMVGLSLTFDGDESYYVVLAHTQPTTVRVTKTRQEKRIADYETFEYVTKGGKTKTKERPVYVLDEIAYEDDETQYPIKDYVDGRTLATLVRPIFAQPNVVMVGHHAKFDIHFLARLGIEVRGKLADTMLAAQLIDENREKGLKELATLVGLELKHYQELEHYPTFHKDEYLGVPLEIAANYSMLDTEATLALWHRFKLELSDEGVDHAFTDLWMPLLPTLQQMEARGIAMDIEKVKALKDEYVAKAAEHEDRIWNIGIDMILDRYREAVPEKYARILSADELAHVDWERDDEAWFRRGDDDRSLPVFRPSERSSWRVPHFKVGSEDHVKELLYDYFELKPSDEIRLKVNKDGQIGVDKDTLTVLRWTLGDKAPRVLDDLLEWRKADKFIGTYLNRYLSDTDPNDFNSLHTNFNQHVADTGRLSSSGPNLQNQTSRGPLGKKCRSLFIARPNKRLLIGDYNMMELRMGAHFSRDETMMEAFANSVDLHTLTACNELGLQYDELKALVDAGDVEADLKRKIAKTENFALMYGMAAPKFQRYLLVQSDIFLPRKEVARRIDGWHGLFHGLSDWKGDVCKWIRRHGYVETIEGRKRRLPNAFSTDRYLVMEAERQGISTVVQGSCADIVIKVMPPIQAALAPLGGCLLLQVHDELVAEIDEDNAELGARLMKDIMEGMFNHKLRVPMKVDVKIATSWADK